jgi:PAS domain S-box-containing protein
VSTSFTPEEALRFVENARTGFAFVDPEGRFQRVNAAYCEILGCMTPLLVVNTKWQQWTHPDSLKEDQDLADKVKAGEISGYVLKKRYIPYGLTKWQSQWGILSVIGSWEGEPRKFLGYDVQFTPIAPNRLSIQSIGQLLLWIAENKAALIVVLTVAAGVISLWRGGTVIEFLQLLAPQQQQPGDMP